MILIITSKLDPHTDIVINYLKSAEIPIIRFNTEDFPQKITFSWQITNSTIEGILRFPSGREVMLSQITSCWYRRPGAPVVSRDLFNPQTKQFAEEESGTLLNGLWVYLSSCFWINYPLKIRRAESKMYNLKLAAEIGFLIPQTLITNNPNEVKDFFSKGKGEVINKVLGKGQVEYLRDYYFIYTHKVLPQDLTRVSSVTYAPALFQEYIPKMVEIRVTVVEDRIFSCEIHSQESEKTLDDWRHYDLENVKHIIHQPPRSIESLCFKMVKKLDLNFATFDFILTPDNRYIFLELNPNGQWLWIEQLTGLPISRAIAELLINSERKRLKRVKINDEK